MTILNSNVLMLNFSYEPLAVVGMRKAVGMLYTGKVETVEANGGVIRSPSTAIEAPSVVRLNWYISPSKRRIKFNRKNVIRRDGGRCMYCGRKSDGLTIDHVTPLCIGGKHDWDNVVACCPECNNRKADRTPAEAGLSLIGKPTEPSFLPYIQKIYATELGENHNWRKYLFLD
jgi:5-methylcytosine-specific restriction endonuclease McrA